MFKDHMPKFDWQVIENSLGSDGVPDHNACGEGVEFWVEYKLTKSNKVDFRPGQPGWIHRRWRHGGRVWIAIRYRHDGGPVLGPPVDDLILVYGGHVRELVQSGLRLDPSLISGRWRGGPRRWPWADVQRMLVGGGKAPSALGSGASVAPAASAAGMERAAFDRGAYFAFSEVQNYLNTLEEQTPDKSRIYKAVSQMVPNLLAPNFPVPEEKSC